MILIPALPFSSELPSTAVVNFSSQEKFKTSPPPLNMNPRRLSDILFSSREIIRASFPKKSPCFSLPCDAPGTISTLISFSRPIRTSRSKGTGLSTVKCFRISLWSPSSRYFLLAWLISRDMIMA
uniref:Sea8 n=1 Tax=Serratia entomophila TaxID=42906 RepID=Q7BQV1_9GAMM|nr:Sea8 [Serratia entomophila]